VKKFRSVFLATLTMGLAVSSLAFDAVSDFKAYLKKFEAGVVKAFATKNHKFFETISTPDFTYTDASGRKMTKKESIAQMKGMFDSMGPAKASFKSSGHAVKGNTATANYVGHFVMSQKGPDGKAHKLEMTSYTKETYKKVGAKWLVHSMVETKPGKMTMDGKPFDPSQMGGPPPAN